MIGRTTLLMGVVLVGSAFALTSPSLALCGVIKKTATAKSRDAALAKANSAGLVEVRKLEKSYGASKVTYKPAKVTCVGGGSLKEPGGKTKTFPIDCTITQSFCTK